MIDLSKLTIKTANKGLVNRDFSAVELANSSLNRINERQSEINAFITVTKDLAIKNAELVDKKIAEKKEINILEGIPCGIKDNIMLQGILCTAASKMLSNYTSSYNATVIKKLSSQGATFVGKLNMDEFAMGSTTEHSFYGTVKNPHDITKVPGGSSGGSAAAVADNQTLFTLGSDTGGSIRLPASFCGVVGMKPTYGRVSRYGLIAMASSFDQIGPLTKTVEDASIVFDSLYGHDSKDATSVLLPKKEDFSTIEKISLKGKKIGFCPDLLVDGMDQEVKAEVLKALDTYKENGAEIVEVKMPHLKYALAVYYILMPAESSSNLSRFDGIRYGYSNSESKNLEDLYRKSRSEGFGDEAKLRVILGTYVLSHGYYDAYYKKAQKVRSLIMQDYAQAFKKVDCLITPTSPTTAFKMGMKSNDPLTMYLADIFTVAINIAGVPAISVPIAKSKSGMPIDMQIICKHFDEKTLFEMAYIYEQLNL